MARPGKLTKEVQDKIVQSLRGGNYIEVSAAYAGINKSTLYDWLKKGARSKRKGIYKEFSNAVQKAQAEAEVRLSAIIQRAAETQWQAAAWHLERKFPERWGRKEKLDIKFEWRKIAEEAGLDPDELYKKVEGLLDANRQN